MSTLHLIGLFHTVTNSAHSACAFTGKVLRYPKMMRMYGWNVIEYGNGVSDSEANEHIQLMTEERLNELKGSRKDTDFWGNTAVIGSPHWEEFDRRLREELKKHVKPKDIIIHPFGRAHMAIVKDFPEQLHVESGIGYPDRAFGAFRIFESYAWMHYHQGYTINYGDDGKILFKDDIPVIGKNGSDYEWVVPNYYDTSLWTPRDEPDNDPYFLFMGRIDAIKGMNVIKAIAENSHHKIVVAGQGDISPWKHDKIEYIGPLKGLERDKWVGGATAMLCPSRFTEPFCGSAVESMLCGTPVISSDFGAFSETIIQGVTGYRCHTLGDWLDAMIRVSFINRRKVYERARSLYSLEACGERYDKIYKTILELYGNGWYSEESHLLNECH